MTKKLTPVEASRAVAERCDELEREIAGIGPTIRRDGLEMDVDSIGDLVAILQARLASLRSLQPFLVGASVAEATAAHRASNRKRKRAAKLAVLDSQQEQLDTRRATLAASQEVGT